jgi:hypothetical protein
MTSWTTTMMMKPLLHKRALEEVDLRRHRSSTFTEPLRKSPDMKEFLTDFYTNVYTPKRQDYYRQEQITYPHVAEHFEVLVLVPAKIVSFEDFWQRYTFRCNVNRVMKELGDADAAAMNQSVTDSMEHMKGMFQSVRRSSAVLNPTTTTKNVADETSTSVEAASQPSNKQEETKTKSFGPQTSAARPIQLNTYKLSKPNSFGPQTSAATRLIQLNTYKLSKPSYYSRWNMRKVTAAATPPHLTTMSSDGREQDLSISDHERRLLLLAEESRAQ